MCAEITGGRWSYLRPYFLPLLLLSLMSLDTFWPWEAYYLAPWRLLNGFQVSYPHWSYWRLWTFSSPHPKATIKFWAVSSTGRPIDLCKAFLIGTYIFVRIRFFWLSWFSTATLWEIMGVLTKLPEFFRNQDVACPSRPEKNMLPPQPTQGDVPIKNPQHCRLLCPWASVAAFGVSDAEFCLKQNWRYVI